jgi:outer membrane protein OmpA-like peptidoglycan-associated protein
MKKIIGVSLVTASLALTACTTTDSYTGETVRSNTRTGALAGAGLGAVLGYLTNTNSGEQGRKNALIGAGIGALAGAGVGVYMDRQQEQLRRDLANSGADVQRQGNDIVVRMPADVSFAVDSSDLRADFFGPLDRMAQTIQQYPQTTVDVIGHADATGDDAYNQALSERRASSVAQYLISRGVLPARLLVLGRGESQPIASNDTVQGRAQNRRVEVILRPLQ